MSSKKKSKKIPPNGPDLGVNFIKKKTSYRTLKTSLKSIIKNPEIHLKINQLVLKCQHIVVDTYMFIRLYCLYQYHHNLQIPDLNRNFISYCMMALGERDPRGKKAVKTELLEELKTFYQKEYQPIFNHQKFDLRCLTCTLPYICQTMETCISVNLKEHFIKRLLRFVNISTQKCNEKTYSLPNKEILWKLKKAI